MMPYPAAPTTFEEVSKLIPPRGKINKHRFVLGEVPFEIEVGRNDSNIVFIDFCVPDPHFEFYDVTRTFESLTTQRAIWSLW